MLVHGVKRAVPIAVWCLAVLASAPRLKADGESAAAEGTPTKLETELTLGAGPIDRLPVDFSPEVYLGHIYYLASDELGGRGVGTPGIDRAAQYIADQFAASGIEPGGENGTYFQTFDIALGAELTDEGEFSISGVEMDPPTAGEDYTPFPWSTAEAFEGDLVIVGYGLVNPDKDYDDYAGLDLTGQVVLMLRREPICWTTKAGSYTRLARFVNKVATAKERGAVAVLIANQQPDEGEDDRLVPFVSGGMGGMGDYGLPAFHVTRALADKMLAAANLDPLVEIQARLDTDPPGHCSAPLPGLRVAGRAGMVRTSAASRNVVGLVRGEGPLADEHVVICAHYDHVGTRARRSMFGRRSSSAKKQVHNGADDNASGTAALIELGQALARQPALRRGVLLIAFTGEESGLLGSEHFADHATVPIENIVACLNMDMIGRMEEDSDTVYVYGTGTAKEFDGLIRRSAVEVGLRGVEAEPSSGRSDDASFYRKQVPAMHFFTGMHADYHRPSDDSDKINEQDAVRIVGLAYEVARGIIDADQRPSYEEVSGFASIQPRGNRVVMGIFPDYAEVESTPGLLIDRLVPDGPAAQAGMRSGDRIIRIAGSSVEGIADYIDAIRSKTAGDEVEVVVARGDEEVTLTVTLATG
ncbi:MAG: M20/M25/M40 family metallo-hydrolase [Planctomycetota bacterium]|jgi:hypothetical protein